MAGSRVGELGGRREEGEMLAGEKLRGSGNWGKNILGGGCSVLTLGGSPEGY